MRVINHALTGTLIGLGVGRPIIALPLALLSHFICDVIPHYGGGMPVEEGIRSRFFLRLLYVDAVLAVGLVLLLAARHPMHWFLAAACAFVAAAPDLVSYRHFASARAHRAWQPNRYERFAGGIQWFERPIGSVVEVAWLIGASVLLATWLS